MQNQGKARCRTLGDQVIEAGARYFIVTCPHVAGALIMGQYNAEKRKPTAAEESFTAAMENNERWGIFAATGLGGEMGPDGFVGGAFVQDDEVFAIDHTESMRGILVTYRRAHNTMPSNFPKLDENLPATLNAGEGHIHGIAVPRTALNEMLLRTIIGYVGGYHRKTAELNERRASGYV